MRLAVPGWLTERSGIGVMQRALYPRLSERGLELELLPSREPPGSSHAARIWGTLRGLQAMPSGGAQAYLALTTPLPLRLSIPTVGIVHDLRWLRTRSLVARRYRSWDLGRMIDKCGEVIAISKATQDEVLAFIPGAKSSVVHPGPGQMVKALLDESERVRESRSILLMGGASHKRNLLAAQTISELPRRTFSSVIGVGLSTAVEEYLVSFYGSMRCEFFHNISPTDLCSLYRRSLCTFQFSVEEGFGFPYIEALATGVRVVAIDQPLTRELLGDAAVLLKDGGPRFLAGQLRALESYPSPEAMLSRSELYSWDVFADGVVDALTSAVGP